METRDVVHAPPRPVMLRRLALPALAGATVIAVAELVLFPWLRGYLAATPVELARQRLDEVFLAIAALLPRLMFGAPE